MGSRSLCLSALAHFQTWLQTNILQIREKVWVFSSCLSPTNINSGESLLPPFSCIHTHLWELPSTLQMWALWSDAIAEGVHLPGQTQITCLFAVLHFCDEFKEGICFKIWKTLDLCGQEYLCFQLDSFFSFSGLFWGSLCLSQKQKIC